MLQLPLSGASVEYVMNARFTSPLPSVPSFISITNQSKRSKHSQLQRSLVLHVRIVERSAIAVDTVNVGVQRDAIG